MVHPLAETSEPTDRRRVAFAPQTKLLAATPVLPALLMATALAPTPNGQRQRGTGLSSAMANSLTLQPRTLALVEHLLQQGATRAASRLAAVQLTVDAHDSTPYSVPSELIRTVEDLSLIHISEPTRPY